MLHRPPSRTLFLVGVVGLALTARPGPAPADVYFETSYLPTTSIVGVSPSLLSTSYVIPTAYTNSYLPTSYLSTSSVVSSDSVVYPTSTTVLRRSFFRPRRYVERNYYSYPITATSYVLPRSYVTSSSLMPTAYYTGSSLMPTAYYSGSSLMPTTYLTRSIVSPSSYVVDDSVITTSGSSSSYPCETSSPSPTKTTATRPLNENSGDTGGTITSVPSNGGATYERRPQGAVNSSQMGEDRAPSGVKPAEIPEPVKTPVGKQETPPPVPSLPEPDTSNVKMPEPGSRPTPVAPQGGETTERSSLRPIYNVRNILRGRVISADSRQPEEGVTVIVSNVTKNFGDRPTMTNADGEFRVSLPDGDWTVKVKMPSGTVYSVGRDFVTASSGRVTDSSGRNVTEFLITR